jgi:hypothetical protein
MKRLLIALSALTFAGAVCCQTPPEEFAVRKQIAVRAASLWAKEDFAQLDKLCAEYRITKTKTPGGLWRLTELYKALAAQAAERMDRVQSLTLGEDRSKRWVAMFPNSPAAHLQYAGALVGQGWNARGTGFSNTVTPEGAALFRQKTSLARDYLEKNKQVASVDPHWYAMMLDVATWQGWPESAVKSLLEEALSRDPTYLETYFKAVNHYSRYWRGSDDRLDQFIKWAADRTPGPDGDALYARRYWGATEQSYNGRLNATGVDCVRMMRGVDRLMQTFPDRRNINYFAKFSVDCGDKQHAKALFEMIGDDLVLEAWWNSSKYYVQFKSWAM